MIELNQRAVGSAFNITDRLKEEYVISDFVLTNKKGIGYKIKGGSLTSEEILAMQLEFVKGLAEKNTGLKDCVLTIPSFYTQAQRKILISVAESAKFNVIGLIHENSAAGLYYGLERFDINPKYIIIYNVGASYIQSSLFKYSVVKSNPSKLSEKKHEYIQAMQHSWNFNLGGRTIDAHIADFIAEKFKEAHGEDPRNNIKAKIRLIQEANRLKKTLSANKVANCILPSLLNGIDYEIKIERSLIDDFINANSENFLYPIRNLLESANVTIEDIQFIEIVGGVSRIPSLQKLISDNFMNVSTHLNGDESMANGAALYGANFSSEVQIRQLWLNDYFPYSVKAEIKSLKSGNLRVKEIFPAHSALNSIKKIAFNSEEDLEIIIYTKYENEYVQNVRYDVSDIEIYSSKYAQVPNVVLSFMLDWNGIVTLADAEARAEIEISVKENIPKAKKNVSEDQATEEKNEKNDTKEEEKKEGIENRENTKDLDEKIQEQTLEENSGNNSSQNIESNQEGNTESNKEKFDQSKDDNTTSSQEKSNENSESNKEKSDENTENNQEKPEENPEEDTPSYRIIKKKKQHKLKLGKIETQLESPEILTPTDIKYIQKKLESFTSFEKEQKIKIELKNDLESYIYDIKEKLLGVEFQKVLSPSDNEVLMPLLESTISWLETLDMKQVKSPVITEKKMKIQEIVEPAIKREQEFIAREDAVLNAFIKLKDLYKEMDTLNKTKVWIDLDTRSQGFAMINDTVSWLESKIIEQEALPEWQHPVLKLSTLEAKILGVEKKIDGIRSIPRPRKQDL